MNKIIKTNFGNIIKKVAVYKANANCIGFMYEPKRPANLLNYQTKVSRK